MWSSTRSRVDRLRRALVLAPALAFLQGMALAAAVDAAHPQLPGSRLQGQATMRVFGIKIYHARLWTRAEFRPSQALEQALVLELEYLRDFKATALAERSLQEMRRAASLSESQTQRWRSEMQRIFVDVKSGDRLSARLQPGQGATFWHNDRLAGQIEDPEFARLFFGIWLAPTTSEPELRQALLGLSESGAR